MHLRAIAIVLSLLAFFASAARAGEELIQLPTRQGVTQPFWLLPAAGKPVASIILFMGGNGVLHDVHRNQNFLIRSREKFADAGFTIASVDTPSDHPQGLDGFRASAEHAEDIAAVIAYLRQRAAVPVWLVGTSMGTISAANVAARLRSGGADGLVLTSSIVVANRRTAPVSSAVDVAAVTVPTLVVHNKDDACMACPFSAVPALLQSFTHAPRKELIAVSGGSEPRSDPCEALSRHGYIGIEDAVVGDIARWIKGS